MDVSLHITDIQARLVFAQRIMHHPSTDRTSRSNHLQLYLSPSPAEESTLNVALDVHTFLLMVTTFGILSTEGLCRENTTWTALWLDAEHLHETLKEAPTAILLGRSVSKFIILRQ